MAAPPRTCRRGETPRARRLRQDRAARRALREGLRRRGARMGPAGVARARYVRALSRRCLRGRECVRRWSASPRRGVVFRAIMRGISRIANPIPYRGTPPMNRIVHISLKVDDVVRTGDFYQQVFGFQDAETSKTRDHLSRHMTDGQIDFTLMKYDAGTRSAESKASGEGPCIHHFAIEVPDVEKARKEIEACGCEVVSDP